jgi:hypothetical protein
VVIAGGLRDGEHVVTTGQSRVTPGARVATTRRAGDSSTTPAEAGAAAATGRGAKRAR